MKRPWQVWLVFVVCVLGAAGAMAWLTKQALDADRLRRAAEAEAELDERVSLALWRMDTELAPIIAEEVIRPPAAFRPSNVAVEPPQYVLLQFEARPNGTWWSPQVPLKKSSKLPGLTELSAAVDLQKLLPQLPRTPLPTADYVSKNLYASNAQLPSEQIESSENPFQFFEGNSANQPGQQQMPTTLQTTEKPSQQSADDSQQVAKAADFQQRNRRYQSAAQQGLLNMQRQAANAPPEFPSQKNDRMPEQLPEQVGVSRPVWVGERLLLARRVAASGETLVQGCWLDWPRLKSRLLAEATDLLTQADLVPVNGDAATDPSRMLAGLPVRLVVGETSVAAAAGPTLRWALWLGWGAVLVAVAAAAALLHGVMTLSERRAAFVSSVTHELRTPLTTFRMYAEMLARGMVPDAQRRQEYFNTLEREAERLTLLVENVLAYARLERGRKPQAQDRVTLASLLDRVGTRLEQRVAQADMQCVVQLDENAAREEFTTDQAVVEQILFNLVDNAAKYARNATDRRIHVEANRNGQSMRLVVRDHGPGIERNGWSGRTQPFGKSAHESADSAPGVGLGLALCQRLARQLGGRLEIADAAGGGASVTLLLPAN